MAKGILLFLAGIFFTCWYAASSEGFTAILAIIIWFTFLGDTTGIAKLFSKKKDSKGKKDEKKEDKK